MTTIKDIARKTGRSVSTVSVVLRGMSRQFGIKPETEAEIRKAAAETGYIRNDCARAMVCGRSRVLGFISEPRRNVEYSGRLLAGALECASGQEYSLRVFHFTGNDPAPLLNTLLAQKIPGILISGELGHRQADRIIEACLPYHIYCVTVNLSNRKAGGGVTSDDTAGIAEMVGRLAHWGHRKIAMLATETAAEYADKRRDGYLLGMERNGLTPSVFFHGEKKRPDLDLLVSKGFTAVLCDSDFIAAQLMQQAYAEGIRIPETISVCGFAGMQIADFAAMPLTTIAQDFEGMGRNAVSMLTAALENGGIPVSGQVKNLSLPTKIHIQKTTRRIKNASSQVRTVL